MSDLTRSLSLVAVVAAGRDEETLRLTAAIVKHASEALVLLNAKGRIISVNPAFIRMTGYSKKVASGMTLDKLLDQSTKRDNDSFFQRILSGPNTQNHWEGRAWMHRENDFGFPVFLTVNTIQDEDEQIMNYVAGFTDISEQLQYEERLSQLELRDGPTGLANRNLLTERANQALLQAERYGRNLGVLCICLDYFNEVNNINPAHDELQKLVAQHLVASVRASDTVARITANEFVVLLPEIEDADHVLLVAGKIAKSLEDLSTSSDFASIGIARYPVDGLDMPALLRHADEDRYHNKPKLPRNV